MERNLEESQSSEWHSNTLSPFKKSSKTKKDKDTIKEMGSKPKIPHSFKLNTNFLNIFKKLSISSSGENEKKMSKIETSSKNAKTVNGAKKFHLNNDFADFLSDQMSNLNLNNASINHKKSTLEKCINEMPLCKKDFDKPDNLRTTGNNDVNIENSGKLENSDSDIAFCSNNITIEEINKLDSKSKFTSVIFNECNSRESRHDSKSTSNSDDSQNTTEKEVIERDPTRNCKNKGTHRLNPLERTDDKGKKESYCSPKVDECTNSLKNKFSKEIEYLDQLIENCRKRDKYLKISEELEYLDQLIENCRKRDEYLKVVNLALSHGKQSNAFLYDINQKKIGDQYNNFNGIFKPCTINYSPSSDCSDIDFSEADEELAKCGASSPESECSSPGFQLNDLSNGNEFNINEYLKVSEELEKLIIMMEKSKSLSHGKQNNAFLYDIHQKQFGDQCNNFNGIFKPCTVNYSSSSGCSDIDFSEADEELAKRGASSPESECSSPGFQLNDLSVGNEKIEDFFYDIQNKINERFQSGNLAHNFMTNPFSKSNQIALEKFYCSSKNLSIASQNQQDSYYNLKTKARNKLFNSEYFKIEDCRRECLEMYEKIRDGEYGTDEKAVIHMLKPMGVKKYKRTNLHDAVIAGNLEKTFSIVELHKQCHKEINIGINLRDNKGKKTVLDRAVEKESSLANDLLIEYLKENNAQRSPLDQKSHLIPINTPGT